MKISKSTINFAKQKGIEIREDAYEISVSRIVNERLYVQMFIMIRNGEALICCSNLPLPGKLKAEFRVIKSEQQLKEMILLLEKEIAYGYI
ncbi:hypothetical protein [Photorhabdus heterorhabditis]|uniref:hypothetical protein n=1 Tax=Photorhabdus heterorhabditis TaxID=880156 RepID=UPI001BD3509D|nr:hypothetical protein [Photorhabdus heterorhabditis]MBS9442459.1 hypothetical protein [Photorhabdus heterorhabditis]